jgi:hypothetical protein
MYEHQNMFDLREVRDHSSTKSKHTIREYKINTTQKQKFLRNLDLDLIDFN